MDQIEKELKDLENDQLAQFIWICALRALPFIGGKGQFDYWEKEKRQDHLYSLFYAIDAAYIAITTTVQAAVDYSTATTAAKNASAAVYFAVKSAAAKSAVAKSAYAVSVGGALIDASRAAVPDYHTNDMAAIKAVNTIIKATKFANAYALGTSKSVITTTAVEVAELAIAAADAANVNVNMKKIIFMDLKLIKKIEKENRHNYIALYGRIWILFLNALDGERCNYWGELYQKVFNNGFELDSIPLKRRLSVPNEIQNKGATVVANYLEELEKYGAVRLNEARIIILGEKGAGKTCLARRLVNPDAPMTTEKESTAGVDTTLWKLEKENLNVRIWDFAGHTITHNVHQFFLSERCLYIMVYDGRTEDRNRLEYWLNFMKNYGGSSKAIILINERDKHSVRIPENLLNEMFPILRSFYFSIKEDKEQLEDFRRYVAEYINNNPSWNNLKIPGSYYKVKQELENYFCKNDGKKCKELIHKNEFDKIAMNFEAVKPETLLKDLHALGVCLWYNKLNRFDTLILNPEWISQGIYKIINWVNEQKLHSLYIENLKEIFNDDQNRYPENMQNYLYELMIHYELAYEVPKENCLIIPHLLKEDRPDLLPEFPIGESLMLRYKAEQNLPPNTISRFIVRHNKEIIKQDKEYYVWRTGVVLEKKKGSIALVREIDRTISISVKGTDQKKYVSELRKTLNEIFNSYKSQKPELHYKLEMFGQLPELIEEKTPIWLPESDIYNLEKFGQPYLQPSTGKLIDLNLTLKTYNITAQTLINSESAQLVDNSIHNIFNFYNCNITLQGLFNELAGLLKTEGNTKEAEELETAANLLEQVEDYKTPEDVKKKGIGGRIKRIINELADDNSKLHKKVKGIKNGFSIVQDIAKSYNDIAQWIGLPQIPKPFLKKE